MKHSTVQHSGPLSPEFALLGFLMAGPDHGYDLHQKFRRELGYVWHLSQSQAYATLKRLETRGDISSRLVAQKKLPARQRLRITAQGRRRFLDWLENGCGSNARSIRLEFLSRLYFSRLYSPVITSTIFSRQMHEIRTVILRLERMIGDLAPEQEYNRLSLNLRLRQMMLVQTWMEEIGARFHLSTDEAS